MRENLDNIADIMKRWRERTAAKMGGISDSTDEGMNRGSKVILSPEKIAEMEAAIARGE